MQALIQAGPQHYHVLAMYALLIQDVLHCWQSEL
jgi:hypothetical protein